VQFDVHREHFKRNGLILKKSYDHHALSSSLERTVLVNWEQETDSVASDILSVVVSRNFS
jgi:hypothetical protein